MTWRSSTCGRTETGCHCKNPLVFSPIKRWYFAVPSQLSSSFHPFPCAVTLSRFPTSSKSSRASRPVLVVAPTHSEATMEFRVGKPITLSLVAIFARIKLLHTAAYGADIKRTSALGQRWAMYNAGPIAPPSVDMHG